MQLDHILSNLVYIYRFEEVFPHVYAQERNNIQIDYTPLDKWSQFLQEVQLVQ